MRWVTPGNERFCRSDGYVANRGFSRDLGLTPTMTFTVPEGAGKWH